MNWEVVSSLIRNDGWLNLPAPCYYQDLKNVEDQPQQSFMPSSLLIDGTPATGWSVISVAPVSVKSRPGVFSGFLPVLTKLTIASRPNEAIFSGYCWDVAPMIPALTFLTPGQPPSMATTRTPFSLPSALSAS